MNGNIFRITGRVVDQQTGKGIAGLTVEAWDRDIYLFDDYLGMAVTDKAGAFHIAFDPGQFLRFWNA